MKRAFPLTFALVAACIPSFGGRASLVDRPTVIAIVAEPPESAPDAAATYTVVVATPEGPSATPLALYSFCATPRLLTENGAVGAACAEGRGVRLIGEARGSIAAATPTDACSLFGPDVTSSSLRPRDPDVTGGFFQPVRVVTDGVPDAAFGFQRVTCKLANAPADVVTQFAAAYVPNRNPVLAPLAPLGADAALDAVPRGARVTMRASWTAADAESYPVYDLPTATLVPHRESLRVSWFATAGSFDHDVTGRDEADLATFTEDAWTAPDDAALVHLWAVLRDSRGGAAVGDVAITVR